MPEELLVTAAGLRVCPGFRTAPLCAVSFTNSLIDNSLECVFPFLSTFVPSLALPLTFPTCGAKTGVCPKKGPAGEAGAAPLLSVVAWQRLFVRGRVLTL